MNLVAQINAWLKSDAGKKFACVRDGYYKPPEDGCVGCMLKAAANEIERLRNVLQRINRLDPRFDANEVQHLCRIGLSDDVGDAPP